jgi:ABC-type transport system involved in cytochrome c biogenesis permease component
MSYFLISFWLEWLLFNKQRWTILISSTILSLISIVLIPISLYYEIPLFFTANATLLQLSTLFVILFSTGDLSEMQKEGTLQTLLATPLPPIVIYLGKLMKRCFISTLIFVSLFISQRITEGVLICLGYELNINRDYFYTCFLVLIILMSCSYWYNAMNILATLLFPNSKQLQDIGTPISFILIIFTITILFHTFSYQKLTLVTLIICAISLLGIVLSTIAAKYAFRIEGTRW